MTHLSPRRTSGEPSSRRARWRLAGLVLTVGVLAGACTPGSENAADRTTASSPPVASTGAPSRSQPPALVDARVELRRIAVLEQPVAMAVRPGDPALYVAEKVGRVVALGGDGEPKMVLDLADRVSLGSEQGLLGIAFAPDGAFLYVDLTDLQGDTRVLEFAVNDEGIDPASEREIIAVDQPFSNHNGGQLAFGPDGYLYVALGDGGSAGDPDDNAESLSTLLGKLLRIEPRPSDGRPYGVPPDNPFLDRSDARPEIWALGLRNPWRFSFDRQTGDLWIGDVGQNAWEEVDVEPAGSGGGVDYGWDRFEGDHPFEGGSADRAAPPVYEYPHDGRVCAVTGGYVYRGREIPALEGAYVFGDFCAGRLEAFVLRGGGAREHRVLGPVVENLASFGEDAQGELYALSLSGPVYRLVAG
ncbi:MAG TPA: PQQ-dependent sugar dehydrogenase [Actinomycetota bacterium]|nr:PQQ-dependent sugar dehydrogenase [Actinomycetota bacterium]